MGGKYQADVPAQPVSNDGTEGINKKSIGVKYLVFLIKDNSPSREDLIWDANGGLTEKQVEQYLIVARYSFV